MTQYLFRQIRIDNKLYLQIKTYCVQNDIALFQFYEAAIRRFLLQIKQEKMNYLATYRKGKLLTIRINEFLARFVKQCAIQANVSEARVIYTALITYIDSISLK